MDKFQLQPYSGMQSRYYCPQCQHRSKTFVRYICIQTGEQLAPHVGRCGRQDKCGYHFKPGKYLTENGDGNWLTGHLKNFKPKANPQPASVDADYYIHPDYVGRSFCNYRNNNFVQYLTRRFGSGVADELVGRYRIGTSKYWPGAVVFWQHDTEGYVRSGKIMLYNSESGKRLKQPFNHITWAHAVIIRDGQLAAGNNENPYGSFKLRQCLFGEHLIAEHPRKPVAIVESEKTAIVASAEMPAFVWLACGSLDGLTTAKCSVLKGRQVMLFPDVNAYHKWKTKAVQLELSMPGTTFAVSDVLERMATELDRENGVDLCDVVV
jgi:hypothetical protein